jgi:hypothetical protein
MYLSYNLLKNDKLNYARVAARTQQRTTFYLTYGLINICIVLLVLSFCFYYFSTPLTIEHINIPPRDDLGVFFITLFITALLCLLAFHFRRQFTYLFHLALSKTNYTQVEIWADAKQLRCTLDGKKYTFEWRHIIIQHNDYQTCFINQNANQPDNTPFILIPQKYISKTAFLDQAYHWQTCQASKR